MKKMTLIGLALLLALVLGLPNLQAQQQGPPSQGVWYCPWMGQTVSTTQAGWTCPMMGNAASAAQGGWHSPTMRRMGRGYGMMGSGCMMPYQGLTNPPAPATTY